MESRSGQTETAEADSRSSPTETETESRAISNNQTQSEGEISQKIINNLLNVCYVKIRIHVVRDVYNVIMFIPSVYLSGYRGGYPSLNFKKQTYPHPQTYLTYLYGYTHTKDVK